MRKRTAEGKQVKSHLEFIHAGSVGAGTTHPGFDTWVAPDEIRVIGIELCSMVRPETEIDSGIVEARAEVSRVTDIDTIYALVKTLAYMQGGECTVGVNKTQVQIGNLIDRMSLWFPEGYGIDLDEHDALFFPRNYANSMANAHYAISWAVIYYVER